MWLNCRLCNWILLPLLLLAASLPATARNRAFGYCEQGAIKAQFFGILSTNTLTGSYPNCTVTIYLNGTLTPAVLYADNSGTPKANPFTADANGYWFAYADNGRYDIKLSGGSPISIPVPFTLGDYVLSDVGTIIPGSNTVTLRGGIVTVYPPSIQNGVGVAVAPNGTLISCAGTTTSCLQEAENYRWSHGYDLYIMGGDEPSGCSPGPTCGAITYNTSTTLQFHTGQGLSVSSGAIVINCMASIGSAPCVQVDSAEIATYNFCNGGSFVNGGSGITLNFKPTNPVGSDIPFGIGFYGQFCVTGVVNIHTPTSDVAAVPNVSFDSTLGTIGTSRFDFEEINGSGIGLRVLNPGAGKGFVFNDIKAPSVHSLTGGTNSAFQIGSSAGGGAFIVGNKWDVFLTNSANTGKGFDTYEQNMNKASNIQANFPNYSWALFFETGAKGNSPGVGQLAGVNFNPLQQSVGGDCTYNRVYGLGVLGPQAFAITPGASPWVLSNNYCQDLLVSITGGTVSAIVYEVTSEGPFDFGPAATQGIFYLRPGLNLKVTYTAPPTVIGLL